ncbi:hypothetical protein GOP47_0027295 [Adiantum capillus-veneris]|nr:hypothetical protein GOP47_0027295 [Adiantum capillus-veneris]
MSTSSGCCSLPWRRKASPPAGRTAAQPALQPPPPPPSDTPQRQSPSPSPPAVQPQPQLHQPQPAAGPHQRPAHIFHERQCCRDFCLLYSLNNLYQSETFCHHELKNIERTLPPELQSGQRGAFSCSLFNIITGNYNANVLERALLTRGTVIHSYLQSVPSSINVEDADLKGIILKRGEGMYRPHWAALKKINGAWINLDSHLDAPVIIGNDDAARAFILRESESGSVGVIRVWDSQQS